MTFDDVLDQVLDLLQRQQRVSYRALKVRFQLDDDLLEAVKDEFIYAKKLAVDEENRVLVWTGNIEGTIEIPSPPPQAIPAPLTQETASVQPPSPLGTSRTLDAERRQLTLLFCDLVDSTKLSGQLDPEDWRDVVRAYQRVCTEVIQRYDGHIAQLLGDGLLIYFGYPQAHEDDAHRAVRAGLGIVEAIGTLNTSFAQTTGITLAVRLGIHTGLVVVGEMGGAGRQEQLALGEVPNIASRIQGLAEPNTVVMSEVTSRLVEGYFTCESLGEHTLRGVSQPLKVYRILGASGVYSRLDVAQTRGLTPLVGREQEVGLLLERWAQVKDGHGQVVLLTGDPGIGKSRLVQMLKEHVATEPHIRWECRSSEYYQNTAFYPLTDLFQRTLQWQQDETPDEKLGKLEQTLRQYRLPLEESVPLFAPLLALPVPENRYPLLNLSPQRQRQKTLETIVAILLELAEHQPVLFILEDLHWTDPSTLELLNLLLDQIPTAALLTILTCRPTFQPSWSHRSYLTEITVNRLSHAQVEQIVIRMTDGKTLPKEVIQQIIAKTDGVPLFIEEMTKAILETGHLKEVAGHYALTGSLSTFTIPTTLQDSLMARLDRLVTAKAVAQYAAVIGRQFAYALLQAVSQLDEATLQRELGRLVEAEIVYQRGLPPQSTYIFKHALIQDAAYESLLKSTRQGYHRRIAEVLVEQFPETAETQPELLAQHFTEANLIERAIDYWQQAGEKAMQRSAYVEAIIHLDTGLALLKTLPETPERTEKELVLLTTLGPALIVIKGQASPEVATIYGQARALCQRVGETPQHFSAFLGLWVFYLVRAEFRTARELGEQLLTLAHGQSDITLFPQACRALGVALLFLGEPLSAQQYFEQGINFYYAQSPASLVFRYDIDPGVACLSWSTLTHWLLGYPEQAVERIQQARSLAQQLGHPYSQAFALSYALFLHQYRQEANTVLPLTEETIGLCVNQGFPSWEAFGKVLRGWCMVVQGEGEQGMTQMHQGLTAWRATGAEVLHSYFLGLLADAYRKVGQFREGVHAVDEALVVVDRMEERSYEAELHRLKGELLLQRSSDNATEAETCFHHAMAIAQNQSAKSWELRAATSLARLWQQQGKRQEAHDLLAPVYNWFTEGFDTADLKDAKALLDELA